MKENQQPDKKADYAESEAETAKPRRNPNQQTINLPPHLIENLERIAKRLGCMAISGPQAGKPSWRTMMRYIGMGFFEVRRPGGKSVIEQPVANDPAPPKKERPPFKCHPSSPPKFWPRDTGCMERREWERMTKLGEEDLLALGFTLTCGGTLWRAPRTWAAWNPIPVVPDWWNDCDEGGGMDMADVPPGTDLSAFDVRGELVMFPAPRKGGGK